jgi:autotransporter-associated beta strand protein
VKLLSIIFALLFNLNTFSQSIFISDLVSENSIGIEHVSIQNKKVTIQSQKDLIVPSKVIESYINQGFEVVVKSKKNIDVSASLHFNGQFKNQFILECEDKGQIVFSSFSRIASQNHPLNLTIKTKGDIIVKENAVLRTNGGEIKLQAFEETKRLKKNATTKIEVFGTLNASSKQIGGKIIIASDAIHLSSHSKILAQGNLGGGVILIGGDWQGGAVPKMKESEDIYEAIVVNVEKGALIDASATQKGNGGKVVVWSNLNHPRSNTFVQGDLLAMGGKISGKGGKIETSGGSIDFEKIKVSTIASDGSAGEWLIDPWNFFFNSTQLATLASNLGGANITISTGSNSASGGPTTFFGRGYIVFDASLTYTNSNARTLTLSSNADIWIKGNITSSGGALSLSFNAPSDRRVYLNGDVSTNGGTISVNNSSQINFQKTTGTQTIASNGGAINFSNSNIRLLRHSGTLSINSGSGQLGLGGSGSVEQVNTFFDISSPTTLITWGGAHTVWDNVNGGANSGLRSYGSSNIVSGREYALKLWFWDSWDGGEGGEVIVRESNNTAQYYFRGFRTHNSGFTSHDGFSRSTYQINSESNQGRNNWNDQNVDIYFQAQHNGTLQTYTNLGSDQNDESIEVQDLIEISFPTTTYSSGNRSLELISSSGQLACGTKNVTDLANITFNTNNNDGFVDGIISGATNVTKSGTGRVRFSGKNTYSGTTTVSAGTYRFVPWFTGDVAVSGAFTNNGIVTYETGNVNSRPTIYLNGGISGNGTWNISSDVAPANIWSNRLSFRSTATTSGQINISSHGNLWLEGSNINMTSPIFLDSINSRLRLYGPANATLSTGQITGTGTVDFADGGGGTNLNLAINTGSSNHQFGGIFANSGTSPGPTVLNLRKDGTGTYTLTGNNTYTGTTLVNGGVLQIGNGAATGRLGSGAVTVASNDTLNFNLNTATSFNNGFNYSAAGATIANTSSSSGAMITLSGGVNAGTSGSSILDGGTAGITVSGAATPAGSGAGVWTKGDVTFTGSDLNTLVILSVGTGSTMRFKTNATTWFFGSTTAANAPNVMVDPNITLSQNTVQAAGNLFYNNLSGTGTISLAGSGATHSILGESSVSNLNATSSIGLVVGQGGASGSITSGNITANNGITLNSTSSYVFSGVLAGTTLTKQNTNTVTLTGTNTYSGSTTISGGTLQLGNNGTTGSIGSGSIVNNGTLSINRSDNITLANAISGTGIINKLNNTTATFTNNNSYIGATNITGTLVLQNNAPTSSSTAYQGSGQLRIEPSGSSFTSAFSSSGWTFGSLLTSLTIGKELNTANVTIGSTTTIAGPISVYGGNIIINENLNSSSGNANGDILLKGSSDISLGSSKSITTNGGDVTIWADQDATSGGTVSLLSAASIQTSGGRVVLAGGLDNGSNSGTSNDGIPDGYARGVGVSGISTTGSFSINSGSGSIFMKGSSNNRDGISLSANSSLTGSLISTSGNIDLLGFVENGSVINGGQVGGFIQAGIRTSGGGTINIESNTGTLKIEGNAPRYGLAFGVFIQNGSVYFDSDDATETIIKTANTSNNAITINGNGQHGISFRGLATKIHSTAALGGISLSAVSPSWTTTIYNPLEILAVSGPINWQNSTSTDGIGVFRSGAISFGSKSGVSGLTSSSSNIIVNIQRLTSGSTPFAIATSGQVSILGVNGTASFGQALSTSSFGLNANSQIMTGFTFGAAANTENLSFGQSLTVAGPITAYGGSIAINENMTSSNGSTISLFGNALTFGTNKTVASSGQLVVAPQTASNSIGIGGAAGTLAIPASYFSTNFADGFSNIQIGSNTQTGNISANAFTLRDNVTVLTSGSLTLGGKPILGSNNVTLGSAISSISGTPTHYFQTNGTGTVKRSIGNNANLLFPIGNTSYNPITITNKTGTADTFSINILDTAYLNGSSSGNITSPYVKRTWNISKKTPTANAGSGVDFTFNWNANEVVGTLTNPTLNHHNGAGWNIPTMGTTSVSGNSLTYTGYKGSFSPFAIGGSNTVALPVELKSFNTACQSDYVQVDWTTASEKNNKMFELYKSDNAIDWNLIHTTDGQGDKASETNYQFIDNDKKPAYYRLKDIDFDGIENWSQIIFADCKNESTQIEVYPNPASDYIKVVSPISENTILKIFSIEGKILKTLPLVSKNNLINIIDLSSGIYIIEINTSKEKLQNKIIKR